MCNIGQQHAGAEPMGAQPHCIINSLPIVFLDSMVG